MSKCEQMFWKCKHLDREVEIDADGRCFAGQVIPECKDCDFPNYCFGCYYRVNDEGKCRWVSCIYGYDKRQSVPGDFHG